MDVEALMREERREYHRKWRAKNKDRIREINARYWKNRAIKRLEAKEESTNSEEGDIDAADSNVGRSR